MELKVPPGPASSRGTKSAEEPEITELTISGSDQVNAHKIEQEASSNEKPSPQTIFDSEAAVLDHLSKFNYNLNHDLEMDKTSLPHSRILFKSQHSDTNPPDPPAQNPSETAKPNLAKSLTHVVPVTPQTTESLCHKNKTTCTKFFFLPPDCSSGKGKPDSVSTEGPNENFFEKDSTMTTTATSSLTEGQSITVPQVNETPSLISDSDSLIDLQKALFSKSTTVISGLSATQRSSIVKQTYTAFSQSQDDHPRENSMSSYLQQNSTCLQDPVPLVPNKVSMISSNEIQSRSGHSRQAAYTLSALTCIQKSPQDPSMTSSSTTASSTTIRPSTVVMPQLSHLHGHPNPSPPPPLTTDICQPVVVREEIRLTPQIKGTPVLVPSPASQTKMGPQPQGRVSQAALPCWTRPLSRAAVMEGSPVFLEVEVTPQPKPTVTWWVAYNELHSNTQA